MVSDDSLCIYMFIRNGDWYDYPWREAIESALPIADQIVICECFSDKDNTWEELQKVAKKYGKIELIRREWVTNFKQLSEVGNYCLPSVKTVWHWQLQADEVIHEDSYTEIQGRLAIPGVVNVRGVIRQPSAFRVHYNHFLANYETEFDFCYRDIVRIARTDSPWRLLGDACELGIGDPAEVTNTSILVHHYGKVHEKATGYRKEIDFQMLFKEIGFPDPKMLEMKQKLGGEVCDYIYLFKQDIKDGKVRKFTGSHPKVMQQRIANFKSSGWEQFESLMEPGLKL